MWSSRHRLLAWPSNCLNYMPADELAELVGERRRPSQDGLMVQIALDVFAQRGGAGVAALRLLFERLERDRIQVSAKRAIDLAGAARGLLTNRFHRLVQRTARDAMRQLAGEQLVEDHAQRVYIAACVDLGRFTAGLLGAHVRERALNAAGLRDQRGSAQVVPGDAGQAEVEDRGLRRKWPGLHI